MVWPPADTSLFLVTGSGVSPVVFRRPAGGYAEVSRALGRRVFDAENRTLRRTFALHTITVPLCNLFATRDDADAEFARRRHARKAA